MALAILLAFELIASFVLAVAAITTASARWMPRWKRTAAVVVSLLAFGVVFSPLVVVGVWAGYFFHSPVQTWAIVVTTAAGSGMGTALIAGLWPSGGQGALRAAQWPLVMMGAGSIVALVTGGMTLHRMDRQASEYLRQREAAVLARLAPLVPHVEAEQNGAALLVKAYDALDQDDKRARLVYDVYYNSLAPSVNSTNNADKTDNADHLTLGDPKTRQMLADLQPVIAQVKQAVDMPQLHFGQDFAHPTEWMSFDENRKIQPMAKLLAVDAAARTLDGKPAIALDDTRAILALSAHTWRKPTEISVRVAESMHDVAFQSLQYVLSSPDMAAADLDHFKIESSPLYRPALQRALIGEQARNLATYREMDRNGLLTTLEKYGAGLWDDFSIPRLLDPLATPLYRVIFLRREVDAQLANMAHVIAQLDKPYAEVRRWIVQPEEYEWKFSGPISAVSWLQSRSVVAAAFYTDTTHALMVAAVAAKKYQIETGRYPQSLDELVPKYLPSVPIDPMSDQPIKCVQRGEDLIIYSVGPDGGDDEGKALDRYAKKREDREKGDLVFTLGTEVLPDAVRESKR